MSEIRRQLIETGVFIAWDDESFEFDTRCASTHGGDTLTYYMFNDILYQAPNWWGALLQEMWPIGSIYDICITNFNS